jgi:hypothetical protein
MLLAVGVGLRVLMLLRYPVRIGYDFTDHWAVLDWYRTHHELAPLLLSRAAYHPPLYYVLGGLFLRAGGGPETMQAFSVVMGSLRLVLLWVACERHLRGSRVACCTVLALAGVLPAALHLDGMATQEAFSNVLTVVSLLLMLEVFRSRARRRWTAAAALGATVGVALLTKISALAILGAVAAAALLDVVVSRDDQTRGRVRRAAPWLLSLALAAGISAGFYVHNQRAYGRMILDGWYQRPTESTKRVGAERIPLLDRRTLGFFLGWSPEVWRFPYYPSGVEPEPRFWSLIVASTFADYYNYGFGPAIDTGPQILANSAILGARTFALSCASAVAGTFIAAVTVAAWLIAAMRLLAAREAARLSLLVFSALAVAGQVSFAMRYPYDFEGVVKGIYLHFGSMPMYGLLGATAAWAWARRRARPLALLCWAAVFVVGLYSFYCRLA